MSRTLNPDGSYRPAHDQKTEDAVEEYRQMKLDQAMFLYFEELYDAGFESELDQSVTLREAMAIHMSESNMENSEQ